MSNKQYTKKQRQIAEEIMTEFEQIYKTIRANDAGELFYKLREFMKNKYLSGDKNGNK